MYMVSCMNYSIRDFYYHKKLKTQKPVHIWYVNSPTIPIQTVIRIFKLRIIHKYLNKDSFYVSITMCCMSPVLLFNHFMTQSFFPTSFLGNQTENVKRQQKACTWQLVYVSQLFLRFGIVMLYKWLIRRKGNFVVLR